MIGIHHAGYKLKAVNEGTFIGKILDNLKYSSAFSNYYTDKINMNMNMYNNYNQHNLLNLYSDNNNQNNYMDYNDNNYLIMIMIILIIQLIIK